jgi:hypothetical protein
MKRKFVLLSVALMLCIVLSACAPKASTPAPQPAEVATTASQPTEAAAQPTEAAAAPTNAPAPAQAIMPGGLPDGKGIFLGDQSTVSSSSKARAFAGDRFTLGKYERPYNANTMDTYYPYLDIVSANFYAEADWVYVRVTLVGPDPNNGFPATYAVEIDKNRDGRGDLLIIVDHPSGMDWSSSGVRVLTDKNGDMGGVNPLFSDSQQGDGYEAVLFDQGQGQVPDAAWARLDPSDPNSLDMAFKTSLLGSDTKFLAGLWAGIDNLDPAKFDLNDHFTHEQAGEANPDIANFYPIKELAALDNTCRQAIGFVPNGNEPALCSQGQ